MPVGHDPLPVLLSVPGVRLGSARAGIRKPAHRDLVIMDLIEGTRVAAVFTRNAFCAAPVILARRHLAHSTPRCLVINTGNANAGTGAAGIDDAQRCCQCVAEIAGVAVQAVLPFSTGVIGEALPVEKILAGLPVAWAALSEDGWEEAAWGIMTTDTRPKGISRVIDIDGQRVTVTGMAKGAGMIRPDMATMLAYIATDACISQTLLQRCLAEAVARSFNRISVDGDTSTNDACLLVATRRSLHAEITVADSPGYRTLSAAVIAVCEHLAQAIVRDGEGATKLIIVEVNGGHDEAECAQVAYTVAHSPLVKTAFFAADPNWGRILAAVGRAGVVQLELEAVQIFLDEACIVRGGARAADYTEAQGQAIMAREAITVRIELARGQACTRIWTCDFSYDYVRINADYRT